MKMLKTDFLQGTAGKIWTFCTFSPHEVESVGGVEGWSFSLIVCSNGKRVMII